ncbi:hypothetical protein JAAARDRAFT_39905 [Jaapia argillacea MUCL 33604]|uniref:Macrofage activating glycoprotein n=1 Tax=Jaapia argillacea MUCL 33604 TaxID=933084 RepID=A0A067PQQ7_9AGAM|nr:hypothetical protein JAAARDRAFT_39905 [Jaapia argillacea MUCL 33604]
MARYALLPLLAVATAVLAQDTATPLASKHFPYPSGIPYQADPGTGVRGTQQGYNLCNSTTENQQSLCQTSFVNHIDDFCLWAPPKGPDTIGDTEGEEVAWCTKKGHGTRLIPPGALQGVQYLKTPDYIQIVGFIDQTQINLLANDSGGELDPHGADLRGNPLGGLMYSNAFPSNAGNNNSFEQVIEWHNFMGGGAFCIKVCDPAGAHAADYCQHVFDRIGCAYNDPNQAQNGTFEVCDSDDADYPGVYTANGTVMTYVQPAESLGAISTMPYQPKVAASSNCVTYQSSALYTDLVSVPPTVPTSTGASAKTTGTAKSGSTPGATGSRSGSAAAATPTGASSGAEALAISTISGLAGVLFAMAFLH